MGNLTFITGPVRSGKSRHAVEQAQQWGNDVVFVATYCNTTDDPEMIERVSLHRAQRPAWRTLEAPVDIAADLQALAPPPTGVILDCLTLWASARFAATDAEILRSWQNQLLAMGAAPWPTIIVSNELGWSLVPQSAEARRFRDLAGRLAQLTAAAADDAWLIVAGCRVRLK